MAYNAGDVEARLTLDRSDFITGMRLARAQAESFERDYTATLKLNTGSVNTQVTTMQKRLLGIAHNYQATVGVNFGKSVGQTTEFKKRLDSVAKTYTAKMRLDSTGVLPAITQIQKKLQSVSNKSIKITVDVSQAYQEIMRLNAVLNRVTRNRNIDVTATANVRMAMKNLFSLDRLVKDIGSKNPKIVARADTTDATARLKALVGAQDDAGNASDRYTRRIIAMTTAIIGLGAPALGLLSTLLLTLPTVALMAGAAIGSIALGMDGIKNAAKTLTPAVDKLKASLSATFQAGLTPVFKELAGIFPALTAGLNGQAQALIGWARAFTNVVVSAQGINQLQTIFAGLNGFITALTPSVTSMTQAFMTLGVVGTQNLWALSGALNGWTAGFNAMIQQAAQTGLLATAFQQLGFVVGALLGLLNQLFQSGMQMMAALGPDMTAAITSLTNAFKALTPALITVGGWFLQAATAVFNLVTIMANDLGPVLPGIVAGFIGLYVAIQAAQLITKAYAGVVVIYNGIMKAWQVATAAVTIVQWGLNAALLANPVGIVVAAVILLIAAVVALGYGIYKLIQNWDSVSAALSTGWQWLVGLFYSIWTPIAEWFSSLWTNVTGAVSRAVTAVGTFFSNLGSTISTAFTNSLAFVQDFFWNFDRYFAQGLGFVLGTLVRGLLMIANGFIQGINQLGQLASTVGGNIRDNVLKGFVDAYNWLTGPAVQMVQGWWTEIQREWGVFMAWVYTIPDQIVQGFVDAYNWLTGPAVQMIQGWWAGIQSEWATFMVWLNGVPAAIGNFFTNAGTWLWQAGADIINGLVAGVNSMGAAIRDEFMGIVNGFVTGFKQALGIASPSTLFMGFGSDIIQGLINGVQALAAGVWAAIQAVVNGILGIVNAFIGVWNTVISTIGDVFYMIFNQMYALGTSIFQSLVDFIRTLLFQWQAFWNSTFGAISEFFVTTIDNIRNTGQTIFSALIGFMQTILGGFQAFWSTVWGAISSFFQGIWNAMEQFGRTLLQAMITFYQQGLSGFGQFWNTIWQAILTFFSTIWQQIQTTAVTIWNAINTFLQVGINAFFAFFQNIWYTILNFFVATWNNLLITAQTAWSNINQFFQGAFAAFTAFFTTTWNNIVETFRRIWSGIVAIADGVWNTVVDAFVKGINFVIGIINKFADAINKVASMVGITLNLRIDPISRANGGPIEVPGFAEGGYHKPKMQKAGPVTGRGTSTSDSILTRLSNGEHVWSKREVDAAGGHEAVKRMRAAMLNRSIPNVNTVQQEAAPSMEPIRNTMAMQAAQVAPKDLGSGMLDGLKRMRLMEKYPIMDDFGVPGLAPGGVRPHVAAASDEFERLFGRPAGGIGGLGARANASDHPKGLALDLMTLGNVAQGTAIANHAVTNAGRLGVKYVIYRQRINTGSGWRGMEDRGSVTANHMDHPHVSFNDRPGTGGAFSGGDAGGGFFQSLIRPLVEAALAPVRAGINAVGTRFGFPGQMAAGAFNKILDGLLAKADTMDQSAMSSGASDSSIGAPGVGGGGAVERWRPLVIAALQRQGQPTDPATVNRVLNQIRSESGGNPNAINNYDINAQRGYPSRGLLQTIPQTFARYRDPGLPNNIVDPFANINASIRYALARYGTLARAYRGVGYDNGGILPKGLSMVGNFTNGNEQMAVFNNEQWAALLSSAELARDFETMANEQITNNNTSGIDAATLQAILQQVTAGQSPLSITANLPQGTTVKQLVQEILFQKRHSERGVYS